MPSMRAWPQAFTFWRGHPAAESLRPVKNGSLYGSKAATASRGGSVPYVQHDMSLISPGARPHGQTVSLQKAYAGWDANADLGAGHAKADIRVTHGRHAHVRLRRCGVGAANRS